MKLIRIADREDWLTVHEYLSDDLASDTEDEKEINKVILSASAKRAKREKLKKVSQRRIDDYEKFKTRYETNYSSYHNVPNYKGQKRGYHNTAQNNMSNKVCWECDRMGSFHE